MDDDAPVFRSREEALRQVRRDLIEGLRRRLAESGSGADIRKALKDFAADFHGRMLSVRIEDVDPDEVHLEFDGRWLYWKHAEGVIDQWPAVSGNRGFPCPRDCGICARTSTSRSGTVLSTII